MTDEATVTHNPDEKRYEVHADGTLAGFAEYMLSDGLITFTHTEIDPAFEGRGLGSKLVRGALDDVREVGERKVLPLCPFVKAYMIKHPEYQDLAYGR
ncbi:MAG: GNAT family N-acetyltransferase [Propionibacteriaceae bacterium]|nr:GNAT family N-acetyltransferase [Propionibacteriaceae bacterium]